MKYGSCFMIGDRVESRAAFEHNRQHGTVIAFKKPYYVPWGVIIMPLQPVVKFDDGETVTMKEAWLFKIYDQ